MRCKISRPLSVDGDNKQRESLKEVVASDDKLFLLCVGKGNQEADEVASRAMSLSMLDYVNTCHNTDVPFNPEIFDNALSAACEVVDSVIPGVDLSTLPDMAFVLLHSSGCFVAYSGEMRVCLVRPSSDSVVYDSKAETPVIGKSQIVKMDLRDIMPDDFLYVGKSNESEIYKMKLIAV